MPTRKDEPQDVQKQAALLAQKALERLARLGGSRPDAKAAPRRRFGKNGEITKESGSRE